MLIFALKYKIDDYRDEVSSSRLQRYSLINFFTLIVKAVNKTTKVIAVSKFAITVAVDIAVPKLTASKSLLIVNLF